MGHRAFLLTRFFFFFLYHLAEIQNNTSEDQTNVKEAVSSCIEEVSSSTKFASPLKQHAPKTGHCAPPPLFEKPACLDFATGIAEAYFSTEYWKNNSASEIVHSKKEIEKEKNEDTCMAQKTLKDAVLHKEESEFPAGSPVPQGEQETNKSHTVVNSPSNSLTVASTATCDYVSDCHSTQAMQDGDVSCLISEVTLTNESDLGSSVSALIEQFDVTNNLPSLTAGSGSPGTSKKTNSMKSAFLQPTSPSDPNAAFHSKAPSRTSDVPPYLTPEMTSVPSPETTEHSLFTIIHEASLCPASDQEAMSESSHKDKPHCVEDTCAVLSCIPPASALKANPKRKCGTNWDSIGNSTSCLSDSLDLEDTITVPFTCMNSTGSSLMEVDGELHDLLITTYEYKREDMSQLASPLKLRSNQDILTYKERLGQNINNEDLYSANVGKDFKFRSENSQQFPSSEYQNVALMYNDYLQIPDTQNDSLDISQRPNMESTPTFRNALPYTSATAQKQSSPCKSKSLGDLTSEDISCNFESKYKYISRGFITSGMRDKMVAALKAKRPESSDSLTEQLRKLLSFDQEDGCQSFCSKQNDDCPKMLVRKLSSRSQSRVRNIASRAKERQEANKQKLSNASSNIGVVLRNKPSVSPHVINRHSTGSYIASYLNNFSAEDLEGRGVPEGACTSLRYGYNDRFYTDDSLLETKPSEDDKPEIYFLLRL